MNYKLKELMILYVKKFCKIFTKIRSNGAVLVLRFQNCPKEMY